MAYFGLTEEEARAAVYGTQDSMGLKQSREPKKFTETHRSVNFMNLKGDK